LTGSFWAICPKVVKGLQKGNEHHSHKTLPLPEEGKVEIKKLELKKIVTKCHKGLI
jgi:hypothetical protein